jgi:predicted nucleotidyltransferase
MKACGIVAEYNPLHTGHVYQMNKAKQISQDDCIIVVMSGNFVQRGEPQ